MSDHNSGPRKTMRGIGIIGSAKQFIGSILGCGGLVEEGKAQQDQADAAETRRRRPPKAPAPAQRSPTIASAHSNAKSAT